MDVGSACKLSLVESYEGIHVIKGKPGSSD